MKTNNSFELKPCPFCGEIPKIEKTKVEENVDCKPMNYISAGVWCSKCWYGLCNAVINEEDAGKVLEKNVKRWNTRAKLQ